MIGKLVAKGLHEITVRPAEFARPLSIRGTTSSNPVTLWEARVSNLDKSRPDYISRKTDPDEALTGAIDLFFRQRDSAKKKPEPELDQEAEDLI